MWTLLALLVSLVGGTSTPPASTNDAGDGDLVKIPIGG